MIDPKIIRQQLPDVIANIAKRGMKIDQKKLEDIELERKLLQVKTQKLQNEKNERSKCIGLLKAEGKDVQDILKEMEQLSDELAFSENKLKALLDEQHAIFAAMPNLLHASVPLGADENSNQEVRRWKEPGQFDFTPQDHVDLGELHDGLDFKAAAKMSGSRFVVLRGELARLHRVLGQFMLDVQTKEHGYQEYYVPYLVEGPALFGAGQLPKFHEDLFHTKGDRNLSLIPTAEVSLANLVRDSIIPEEDLPLKFTSHTPCFRSEAGSYGKDTRGMIRQHQFDKIELVQVVRPEDSYQALEELTRHAETILQKLDLPYRVMALCSGDIGFCSAKTYDIEVWLPGQSRYREISSCSNVEAFQARRLMARYKRHGDAKPEYVHMLNGSGLAVGRTLIAVMENYQDSSGNIHIPKVLQPYFDGKEVIKAPRSS